MNDSCQLKKQELQKEYELRFRAMQVYRDQVWKILTQDFFQRFIPENSTILDLGCGWGEFINNIKAKKKFAMDLNPAGKQRLATDIEFLNQDCSVEWDISERSLDIVFTSNFFEHLPSKAHIKSTLLQAYRCLRPGGKIICLGPNIKFIPGLYWDFWDHHIEITELSLKEILEICSFSVDLCQPKFLPYTMVNKAPPPLAFVKWYVRLPFLWKFFGKQFLVIASKAD